ncbi:MAG: metallophosphoesterase [Weissella hellenica]|uniref:metallophosphoesterase n=1 Tax=Weissella hellenica TaxID=46256 RepID=UPI00388B9A66
MTKIIVSSDNHFDVNKQDVAQSLHQQATTLHQLQPDYYLIAGDLFNDFEKSLHYVHNLQNALGQQTKVLFIAGNHDMGRNISFNELETDLDPLYLHNQYIDIPNSNWRIIGHNGWYDYSFTPLLDPAAIVRFRSGFYYDRVIDQPISDIERMALGHAQMRQLLDDALNANKQVVFFTHFSPINDELYYPDPSSRWAMVNGVLGSKKTGLLLAEYPNVQHIFYGHVHITVPPRQKKELTYYNASVGYNRHHLKEWTADNFYQSWVNKLIQIVLTNK